MRRNCGLAVQLAPQDAQSWAGHAQEAEMGGGRRCGAKRQAFDTVSEAVSSAEKKKQSLTPPFSSTGKKNFFLRVGLGWCEEALEQSCFLTSAQPG